MKRYIVGRGYDWAFFLLPPLLSLLLGIAVSGTSFARASFTVLGEDVTWEDLAIGTLIHAHLVAVFARSHANPSIFRRHPVRFIAAPIALWIVLNLSAWLAVAAAVLATFWDVWHSGAQTFGLGRIYDRNHGNSPEIGRRLDYWMNHLLYAGPILAGATMIDHFGYFARFEEVGSAFFTEVPAFMDRTHAVWTAAVLALGTAFVLGYVLAYVRLHRRGYRVSPLKVFLVASTGLCSIYTWGFNTWGEAFFIMNLFHAVQYLALVWASEKDHIARRLGIGAKNRYARTIAALVFFGGALIYGMGAQLVGSRGALWTLTVVVSLMHFWYDGFIWSVRRSEV